MAYEIANYSVKISLVAAADLSALQYKMVKLDSNGKAAAVAANTDRPIGILQNAPTSGKTAEVLVVGGSKVRLGGTVDEGAALGTDADGDAVSLTVGTDTTRYIVGTAVTAGASGEYITAVVNFASAGRAA